MENQSYHVPFYVVDGGVATSGHSSDMTAKQLGLFNRSTFNVSTAGSTEKEVFLAQAPNGGKDWYGLPITGSHKSPFFLVKDVEDIYVSLPQTIQNEEWILGYNGAASSKGLKFVKGEATRVKLYFHGEPIYRFFNGPKEYVISHTPLEPCVADCEAGTECEEVVSDPILEAKALVQKINDHTELKKFGVVAHLVFDAYTNEGTGGLTTATRTLRITLPRTAAGGAKTSAITTAISGVYGINIGTLTTVAGSGATTEGISDDYTVTQTSYSKNDAEGGLSSNVAFNYAEVPAIEGASWVQISETDAATTAAATPVANRKVGIRINAGYIDPKFGTASFDPSDYYEVQPIKMEVSLLQEDGSKCDAAEWGSQLKTKEGRIARQTGEYVVRELWMKSAAYLKHINSTSMSPREREAFDMKMLDTVDRNAFYKLYYVRFRASYGNASNRKNEQETFTAVFALKDGTLVNGVYTVAGGDTTAQTAFETNIIGVLETRSGITRHTNS